MPYEWCYIMFSCIVCVDIYMVVMCGGEAGSSGGGGGGDHRLRPSTKHRSAIVC